MSPCLVEAKGRNNFVRFVVSDGFEMLFIVSISCGDLPSIFFVSSTVKPFLVFKIGTPFFFLRVEVHPKPFVKYILCFARAKRARLKLLGTYLHHVSFFFRCAQGDLQSKNSSATER